MNSPSPTATLPAELHLQAAPHDQKQLVLVGVVVPDELPQELHELYVLRVEVPHHFRLPVLRKQPELLGEVDRDRRLNRATMKCTPAGHGVQRRGVARPCGSLTVNSYPFLPPPLFFPLV